MEQKEISNKPEVSAAEPVKTTKRRKWPWILLAVFILLALGAGMTGFVPGLSDALGANSPRDLGVKVTKADYDSAVKKVGFILDDSAGLGPNTRISYQGQKQVSATFSQEEISALVDFNNADLFPVKDMQIKISKDGTLESSAKISVNNYNGYTLNNAVYAKGKIEVASPKTLKLEPEAVMIGRIPTPVTDTMLGAVEKEVNAKLASIPGLTIQSVSFDHGKINFKGTIPASAKRVLK